MLDATDRFRVKEIANFPKNEHWRRRTLGRINASSSEILERRFFEGSEHGVDTGLISTSTRLKLL